MGRSALRHWPLLPIGALAALLNSWALGSVGWGNQYYAAAVRSMSQSWHAFVFGAFDSEGFVTVDKPPLSLWVQALTVKMFGFHQMSLLVPQVLAGVGAVVCVYVTVVHRWGRFAATIAALALAISPINVMVNHSNNTDAILTLMMTACVAAGVRAAESGRARWLFAAAVLFGAAFTTKMLAAFPVLPAILVAFALGAPVVWRRRAPLLIAAGALAVASALAWFAYVDLTPDSARPYVGSSPTNSAFQLAFDRNGLGQVEGGMGGPGGPAPGPPRAGGPVPAPPRPPVAPGAPNPPRVPQPPMSVPQPPPGGQLPPPAGQLGTPPGQPRGFAGGAPGVLRLFNSDLGTQIGWIVLPGLLGAVAVVAAAGPRRALRTPSLVAPVTWFAVGAAGYSITRGIVHPYYVASIVPPLAMLIGAGAGVLRGNLARRRWLLGTGLAVAACGAANWTLSRRTGHEVTTALAVLTVLGGVAVAALALTRQKRPWPWLALMPALVLLAPFAWTIGSLRAGVEAGIPYADATGSGPRRPALSPAGTEELVARLVAERDGERWLVAVPSAQLGAPIIIATGEAVMALGGFSGSDPILTPSEFDALVDAGEVRFVYLGPGPDARPDRGGAPGAGQGANSPIVTHVRAACDPVPAVAGELYDCAKMTA